MKKIKKLFLNLKIYFDILFNKFKGAEEPETPVIAGLDAIVKQDGKTVGYATNVSANEDFELAPIRTLGFHGDRGFKSMGYNCRVTVGTFGLQGTVSDSLKTPTRKTIITSGYLDFELIDLNSGLTLYILKGCKCSTKDISFDGNSLVNKNTTWFCRELLEKNVS